jgi:nucleotide-binding universal stress UspA family protein
MPVKTKRTKLYGLRSPHKLSNALRLAPTRGVGNYALQIKTILVPVDFSRESFRVLEYSILVAEQFGAAIHLVHVRPFLESMAVQRARNMLGNYQNGISYLQDRLADIQRKHKITFSPDFCHISSGRPFEEICKLAGEIDVDLIILGTRGYSGLKRVLLGSTAERVIRYARCPVLVPRGKSYLTVIGLVLKTRLKLPNILVPIDFSEYSVTALNYAIFLAEKFKARLRLFHTLYHYGDLAAQNRIDQVKITLTGSSAVIRRR